jgi:hypothetical protein
MDDRFRRLAVSDCNPKAAHRHLAPLKCLRRLGYQVSEAPAPPAQGVIFDGAVVYFRRKSGMRM